MFQDLCNRKYLKKKFLFENLQYTKNLENVHISHCINDTFASCYSNEIITNITHMPCIHNTTSTPNTSFPNNQLYNIMF